MDENESQRQDEIETLSATFPNEFSVVSDWQWEVIVEEDRESHQDQSTSWNQFKLVVKFDEEYPEKMPTSVEVFAFKTNLRNEDVSRRLTRFAAERAGYPICYELILALKEEMAGLQYLDGLGMFRIIDVDCVLSIIALLEHQTIFSLLRVSKVFYRFKEHPTIWSFQSFKLFGEYPEGNIVNMRQRCISAWMSLKQNDSSLPKQTEPDRPRFLLSISDRIGTGHHYPQHLPKDTAFVQELEASSQLRLQRDQSKTKHEGLITTKQSQKIIGSYVFYDHEEAIKLFSDGGWIYAATSSLSECRYISGQPCIWIGISTPEEFLHQILKHVSSQARGIVANTRNGQWFSVLGERHTWFNYRLKPRADATAPKKPAKTVTKVDKVELEHLVIDQKVLPRIFQLLAPIPSPTMYSKHTIAQIIKTRNKNVTAGSCQALIWMYFFTEVEPTWERIYRSMKVIRNQLRGEDTEFETKI